MYFITLAGLDTDIAANNITEVVDNGDSTTEIFLVDGGRFQSSDAIGTVKESLLGTTGVAIDESTSGNHTLVAAVASKKIVVISLFLVCGGAVSVKLEDGAGGSALCGAMPFAANGGIALPENKSGWFKTSTNTLLNMNLSANEQVSGALTYITV